MKYLPCFNGEGETTREEHAVAYYSFADKMNLEHKYVCMRIFAQSLKGEVKKWFKSLPQNSIKSIENFNDTFLKKWGDKEDYFCYITEFGALRRKNGEFISYFSKRFNNVYNKSLMK